MLADEQNVIEKKPTKRKKALSDDTMSSATTLNQTDSTTPAAKKSKKKTSAKEKTSAKKKAKGDMTTNSESAEPPPKPKKREKPNKSSKIETGGKKSKLLNAAKQKSKNNDAADELEADAPDATLGPKIRRLKTKSVPIREAAMSNAARTQLVKIIEDGNLSPSDRLKAVRSLRASLVRKLPSTMVRKTLSTPVSPLRRNTKDTMSIRAGMLQKPSKKKSKPDRRSNLNSSHGNVWRGLATPKPVKTGPIPSKPGFDIKSVNASELQLVPLETPQPPVPKLSYGLERVLFNPGVYHLQDPRSRVFNFDPYLAKIMPVSEFDFNALKQYITSSRDETLLGTAKAEGKKYTGSTSSMTSALAHFHFLLSQWRPINTGALSQSFPVPYSSFTSLQRGPSAIFLRWKDGVYAIDADKQYDTANILSMLGKSMEKLLTLPTEDFEKYRRENSDQITEEQRNEAEAFNYTTIGDFLLRSQLDAYDSRLPGSGMFDLKTRAVVSIRMDTKEYEQGMGYEIRGRHGEYESFEREYYDMIRAAFLKYSLQVRMGRMDGIFVAFHNTERIFGFQYISLSEMDYALHGTDDTTTGDSEFKLSLDLLNRVLDRATAKYPETSLRLHFETRGGETPFMYVFAEPMKEDEIQTIQESNKTAVLDFERSILGMDTKTEEELLEERKNAEWQSLRTQVEESMEKDEFDIQEARKFAEVMMEESGSILGELSAEEKEKFMDELMASFEDRVDRGAESSTAGEAEDPDDGIVEDGREIGATATGDTEDGDDEIDDSNEDETIDEEEEQQEEDEDEEEDEEDEEEEEDENEEDQEEEDENEEEQDDEDNEVEREEADDLIDEDGDLVLDAEAGPLDSPRQDVDDRAPEVLLDGGEEINKNEPIEPEVVENEQLRPQDKEVLSGNAVEEDIQPADETTMSETLQAAQAEDKTTPPPDGVLAMTLTIRNKINGKYIERPINLEAKDKWTVEYALADIPEPGRARLLYEATKRRRHLVLHNEKRDEKNDPWNNAYIAKLKSFTNKGRMWRANQSEIEKVQGAPKVLNSTDVPKGPKDAVSETKEE